MELVEGKDLEKAAKPGCLTLDEVKQGICQLLGAVDHIHKLGITHRDIKPANLMVESSHPFNLKLIDFGLSTFSHYSWDICGTLFYCAPEILLRQLYNNKVDIWSIGIIAAQYLYRIPEWNPDAQSHQEWVDDVLKYLYNQEESPALAFVLKLLRSDSKTRPSAERCLKDEFFTGIPNTPTPIPTPMTSFVENGNDITWSPSVSTASSDGDDDEYDTAQPSTYRDELASGPQAMVDGGASQLREKIESTSAVGGRDLALLPIIYHEEGLVCIRIGEHRVSMRTTDNYLNATEICAASDKDPKVCSHTLRQLKKLDLVVVENKISWLPFAEGVIFGNALNVFGLGKLALSAATPAPRAVGVNTKRANGANQPTLADQENARREEVNPLK